MLRSLIAGLALVVSTCGLATASAEVDPYRLTHDVAPVHQSIHLDLDADSPDYSGSIEVLLRVSAPADHFRFHARDMDLTRVELQGAAGEIEVAHEAGELDLVTVTPAATLVPGDYTLRVDFARRFDTTSKGLYRVLYEDHGYLFTQFQAVDARGAFPCWDEPSFKITWDMTITAPEDQVVLFNTPVVDEATEGGQKTLTFRKTKPMPSYLLAMAVGPFESVPVEGLGVAGSIWTPAGKRDLAHRAAEMTPPILAALEEYFGQPYPYEKLDQIAVPEFWPGAMENVGLITYRDTILLVDENGVTVSQLRRLAEVIAHELAHQWFGNLVTMEWWDDLWLNESFATWCGNKITDQVYPELGMAITNVQGTARAMGLDSQMNARAVRKPVPADANMDQLADALAYQKGEAVLNMFEGFLGEEAFRDGVLAYLEANAWSNATAGNLWSALGESSGVDVGAAMATFLDQPGVPLVRAHVLGDGKVELTQERFLNYGADLETDQTWRIPVVFRYSDGRQTHTQRVVLTERSQVVALAGTSGEPEWLHPNRGETGYYRWSMDPRAVVDLVEHAQDRLEVRERVGLVSQVSALLDNGELDGGTYLRCASALAADERAEVVSASLGALGKVRTAFITPDLLDPFRDYVQQTLRPVLDGIGLRSQAGEAEAVELLRPNLIRWLGAWGNDPEVVAYATEVADRALAGSADVDPSIAGACLAVAALEGDWRYYNALKTAFEEATIPAERQRFLGAMGRFRSPAIAKAALHYSISGQARPQEMFSIPMGVGQLHDEDHLVWKWFQGNYQTIRGMIPESFAIYLPYFAQSCSAEQWAEAEAYFGDPDRYVKGQETQMAKVGEETLDCAALRERERDAVAEYLRSYAGM